MSGVSGSRRASTVVWEQSLSGFKVYGSKTPLSFNEKLGHFPDVVRRLASVVFVDVLRATSTLTAVAAAGCDGIYLDSKPTNGDCRFMPPVGLPEGRRWLYGGELNGAPIVGTDEEGRSVPGVIGNSPLEVRAGLFKGCYLRFYSTNGTRAIQELATAELMAAYAMSMANIAGTMDSVLASGPDRIWLACGGFYGSATLEDSVACGLAIEHLLSAGFAEEPELDDEARGMLFLARRYRRHGSFDASALVRDLQHGQVGRLLRSLGRGDDIAAAITGLRMHDDLWQSMAAVRLVVDHSFGSFLRPEAARGGQGCHDTP